METNGTQRRLNFYCQVMIVLLALIAVRLWMSPIDVLPQAQAQFMDSGAQRLEIVRGVERTNELLIGIHETLKGTLAVKLDDQGGAAPKKPPAPKRK